MKTGLFLLLIAALSINFISASYACSNGTIEEDQENIGIGEIGFPNRIAIGVIQGDRKGPSAEILIDAKSRTLRIEVSDEQRK